MQIFALLFAAIIVEGLITYFKTMVLNGKFQWQQLTAILVGVGVAIIYNVDIFAMFGVTTTIPFVGSILSGILISRVSNYIFDLVKQLNTSKETPKV